MNKLETAIIDATLDQELTISEKKSKELFENIYQNIINKKEQYVTIPSRINSKARRRYYLHHMFRKKNGLKLNAKKRTILVPVFEQDTIRENKYAMLLLIEFQYNIQLTID